MVKPAFPPYNVRLLSKRVHDGLRLDILLVRMQILFAIAMVSFLVVVVAALAIVRHVRAGHRRSRAEAAQPHQSFSQHLFSAANVRETRLPQSVRQQSVKEITANKTWNSPSKLVEIPPVDGQLTMIGKRKSPQSAGPTTDERLDWAYFNKDYGDLSDPYPSRPIRARSGAKRVSTRRS
jgi:hypothetical protein